MSSPHYFSWMNPQTTWISGEAFTLSSGGFFIHFQFGYFTRDFLGFGMFSALGVFRAHRVLGLLVFALRALGPRFRVSGSGSRICRNHGLRVLELFMVVLWLYGFIILWFTGFK